MEELFSTNKARLLGLHGTALLSRYTLRDVKLVPFQYQAYDRKPGRPMTDKRTSQAFRVEEFNRRSEQRELAILQRKAHKHGMQLVPTA